MRARTAVLLLLAALLTSMVQASIPAAHASDVALAQESESEGSGGGDDGATEEEGSGAEGSEVGANEGQTEPAEEETGPVWTYQMAKIVLALLLIIGLMVALSYWKLVVQRQRRGI